MNPLENPIDVDAQPTLEQVEDICARVLGGGRATETELASLLDVEPGSEQADALAHAREALARRGNGGLGYLYAQIGIDANPCPGNCHFCSFAACNGLVHGKAEVDFDQVFHVAELFARKGVHLISIMSSAAYRFDRYLELIERLRTIVGDDVALMANTRDLSLGEAKALADAGADCLYHAVRLGEGVITGLDEAKRWETLDYARSAGLSVSTAVGPLFQPVAPNSPYFQAKRQIVTRFMQAIALKPICSGVTTLHAVAGTKMAHVKPWSPEKMRVLASVFQLAARDTIPHGGANSIRWEDAGLDPRQRGYTSDDARLTKRIDELHLFLEADGWQTAPPGGMLYKKK